MLGAAVVPSQEANTRGHLVKSTSFTGPELGFMPTELREKTCRSPEYPLVYLEFPRASLKTVASSFPPAFTLVGSWGLW